MSRNDHGPTELQRPASLPLETEPRAGESFAWDEQKRSPQDIARILQERARNLARADAEAEKGEGIQVVAFALNGESYAVEVGFVRGINPLEDLTPVPCTPDFVAGVVNLRGRILSVIDLHRLIGLEGVPAGEGAEVISISAAGLEVGLLVSRTYGVRALALDELDPALPTTARMALEYTRGVTPDMLVLLDLEALLGDERVVVWEEVG